MYATVILLIIWSDHECAVGKIGVQIRRVTSDGGRAAVVTAVNNAEWWQSYARGAPTAALAHIICITIYQVHQNLH